MKVWDALVDMWAGLYERGLCLIYGHVTDANYPVCFNCGKRV